MANMWQNPVNLGNYDPNDPRNAYPRVVKDADGNERVAVNHEEHTRITGIPHGPDGKPLSEQPAPAGPLQLPPEPQAPPPGATISMPAVELPLVGKDGGDYQPAPTRQNNVMTEAEAARFHAVVSKIRQAPENSTVELTAGELEDLHLPFAASGVKPPAELRAFGRDLKVQPPAVETLPVEHVLEAGKVMLAAASIDREG